MVARMARSSAGVDQLIRHAAGRDIGEKSNESWSPIRRG
jgi:hypothetical protein